MKVDQLRRLLSLASNSFAKGCRHEEARAFELLADALKPADKLQVSTAVERLECERKG